MALGDEQKSTVDGGIFLIFLRLVDVNFMLVQLFCVFFPKEKPELRHMKSPILVDQIVSSLAKILWMMFGFFPKDFCGKTWKQVCLRMTIYIYSSRHVQNLADNMLIKHKHHELYRQNKCDLAYFPEQNMTKPPNQTRISTSFHAARAARLISPMIAPPRKRPTVWGHASAVQVVCVFAHFREDENHPQTGLSSNVASPKLAGWENHRKIPSMDDN